MIDWTPVYLAALPIRWQGATGCCTAASVCYAMELRAIIQGYPARQLSMLYNYWWNQGGPGGHHHLGGAGAYGALVQAQINGVCIESLHPMLAYVGVDTTTSAYSAATWAAVQGTPSAAAMADDANQMLVAYDYRLNYSGVADLKAKAEAALAAGYPLVIATASGTHVEVAMGCDSDGFIILDSRSQNTSAGHLSYTQVSGIFGVIRDVRYANAVPGPLLTVPPVTPPVVVLPPPPPPVIGNTQMLIDGIKTKASALTLGQITQAQIDALKSDVNALIPDAGTVVPPPGGLFVNDIGVGQSFVSTAGDTWSIDAPNIIKVNGRSASGVYGTRVIEDSTGKVKGRRDTGPGTVSWQLWMGGGGWKQTSAP